MLTVTSQEHFGLYCPHCGEMRMFVRTNHTTNHLLHLLVTVLACGLWLPIWFVLAITGDYSTPWLCTQCGSLPGEPPPQPYVPSVVPTKPPPVVKDFGEL